MQLTKIPAILSSYKDNILYTTSEIFASFTGSCDDNSGCILGGYVSKDFVLVNFFKYVVHCVCYGNEYLKLVAKLALDTFSERHDAAQLVLFILNYLEDSYSVSIALYVLFKN